MEPSRRRTVCRASVARPVARPVAPPVARPVACTAARPVARPAARSTEWVAAAEEAEVAVVVEETGVAADTMTQIVVGRARH
mmetsp:Transcript_46600/g.68869  ORF Transcript_46600/g.68869 Transcript_46600/m.68869 type:complete len:82 (+) Transcript_46600:1039-1284(+)